MGKLAITGGSSLRTQPFRAWPMSTRDEAAALDDVLTSTKWGGQPFPGKHSVAFAKKFAEVHTANYAQCVNTGTVAIHAALKAIDIRPGDEVLVPVYTWEGTVGPVLLVHAVPVFIDVDPETYCLDAKLIDPADFPALTWGREKPLDLRKMYCCPESELAAYHEAVWFPHQLFLGSSADTDAIADAIHKVLENLEEVRNLDHKAIRNQRLSRADRES